MIGDNIKKFRIEKGLTQAALAEKLFVTAQAVSRWEHNEVEPSISTVNQIAGIFEISVDELLGNPVKQPEPEIKVEKEYVYKEVPKQVLAICESCNQPIYDPDDICRRTVHHGRGGGSSTEHIRCRKCTHEAEERDTKSRIQWSIARRKKSFIFGALAGILCIIIGAIAYGWWGLLGGFGVGIAAFTFTSCCVLDNNFICDLTLGMMKWGFIRLPILIFNISLEGLIWFLLVKLFLWILGIILAILAAILAITVGFTLSLFVYPYALVKNIKHPEDGEYLF